jgi:hypothetical protein
MRHDVLAVAVPQAVAAGAATKIEGHIEGVVQITGGGSWTSQLQTSLDGVTWFNLGTAATNASPQLIPVTNGVKFVRMNTTAYASGTPVANYGGYDSRTE